ncbi:LysR substrate-binding domain-containing protein [Sodalis sp. RH16]|jgi:DNA-binding transcriptional LysR family regulator|uniref:LysR family transcriptional regulator n=1 Tax=unclassified Sodalis (in: enterobacteria) TaxID=2636512 RepID=UPI0039B57854
MDLKRLKYFCVVFEQGTISQAARILNMAQPPLSKRIQELEEELNVPLFLRNGRRLEPTESGYHLYKNACAILRDVEDTKREIILIKNRESRLLRIGLTHLFQSYFKPLILKLHRLNPNVEISVSVSDSSNLESLLQNGLVDIALIQKPSHSEGYDCISFAPINLVAVINKKLSAEIPANPIPFLSLGKFPLVLLRRSRDAGTYELITDHFRKGGVNPKIIMNISQPGVILDWLQSGLEAAALLPASEVDPAKLDNCHVVDILSAPQIFFPAVVKMSVASYMKELMDIVQTGYPFPDVDTGN